MRTFYFFMLGKGLVSEISNPESIQNIKTGRVHPLKNVKEKFL